VLAQFILHRSILYAAVQLCDQSVTLPTRFCDQTMAHTTVVMLPATLSILDGLDGSEP